MEFRLKRQKEKPQIDENSFEKLNGRLLRFRRISEEICKRANLPKMGVEFSSHVPIACYGGDGKCMLNPMALQHYSDGEMAAIIAHEAWHAKEHSAFPKWIFQLRKHEYDADAFAAQIAGIDATISMLENRDALMAKLSQEAVGVFHTFTIKISHPPTKKRIARLRNLEVGGKASQSTGFAMLSAELE